MSAGEKQRFYRAVSKPARFGAPGEYARLYEMTFRADNSREARDHAAHCFHVQRPGLGLWVDYVQFIGKEAPEGMGEIRVIK